MIGDRSTAGEWADGPDRAAADAVAAARSRLSADDDGIVGVGGRPRAGHAARRLPARACSRCRSGARSIGWFSPDPRAVLPLDGLRVTRSLRRSARRYEVRRDTRFAEVMVRCGDPRRARRLDHPDVRRGLHAGCTSWAGRSSVEAYDDGELVGGLYGVRIGGFFAGESMFHTRDRRVEGGARRARRLARDDRRRAARRAVDDAAPALARRRSSCPRRVPQPARAAVTVGRPTVWRAHCRHDDDHATRRG